MMFRFFGFCAAAIAFAPQHAGAQSRPAQCLLEVKGVHYFGGPCVFTPLDKSGSFRIADAQGGRFAAQINVSGKDEGKALWTGPGGTGEPVVELGQAFRATGCWKLDDADGDKYNESRICAWGVDEKLWLGPSPKDPSPASTVFYGSRVGMYDDIASRQGADTADSRVTATASRDGAVTFCREYSDDYTAKCIEGQLRSATVGVLRGNCRTKSFVDFNGYKYVFVGRMPKSKANLPAEYAIRDTSSGEFLDGSTASNYDIVLGIYQALCPKTAPKDTE